MQITTLGAARTVTGSCHLIDTGKSRVLLDFGMFQGKREESEALNRFVPPEVIGVDSIVLSHGHLDHCGRLPVLLRNGYGGPIYCTRATVDVARVILEDAGQIQEEDAAYLNRRSPAATHHAIEPLFNSVDAAKTIRRLSGVDYGIETRVTPDVTVTFYDAGHILGSSYVVLTTDTGEKLLFTGDIGRYDTPIIRDPVPPAGAVDHIITESTYGTVKHAPMANVAPQLLSILKSVLGRGGRVVLPAFAVGRTQVLLWYMQRFLLAKEIPQVPVFIDSPMGSEISDIHIRHSDNYDDETRTMLGRGELFKVPGMQFTRTSEESRQINSYRGPCVIIASSPTCEFGRVRHHIKRSIEEPRDAIVFTGFTPGGTLGRYIQDGNPRVRIFDRIYDRTCTIATLHGLSAHADGGELLRFIAPAIGPCTTASVVHGEADRIDGFAARLLDAGVKSAIAVAAGTRVLVGKSHPTVVITGDVSGDAGRVTQTAAAQE